MRIINFIKKYWLFILLAALLGMILVFKLVSQPEPEAPSISPKVAPEQRIDQPQTIFGQTLKAETVFRLSFSKTSFERFPQSLPVYQTKKFDQKQILSRYERLIKELGFSNQPEIQAQNQGQFLVWQESEKYLNIDLESGQFFFSGRTSLTPGQENLSVEGAEELVREKLADWGLIFPQMRVETIQGFGLAGLELIPMENPNQADYFQIVFKTDFNHYPLIGFGQAQNQIEVKISRQGVLGALFFNLHQVALEPLGDYPLKTYQDVVEAVQNHQAQLIQVFGENNQAVSFPPLEEILEAEIRTISLAYFESQEKQDFYQPIYLLKGEITLKDNSRLEATFFLPAVAYEWLEPL